MNAILALLLLASQLAPDDAYYQKLRDGCEKNDNCCLASVSHMQQVKAIQHNPVLPVECDEDTVKNMLKCESSYQWCESAVKPK